ncbi:diol dehydratase small subunit [Thermohalobacter berrensis]|uniref:Propanediol dehydratase n=1 Tax=Thermohalobacter berrensis TaxID=99594 RepID=A0A419T5M2_9FIRM|nr:diol dehydratase small subunit [Thermohalobacter berrensis]RKD32752.1 propanediol dehydratase [Thermohalobacter berrensis]
MIQEQRIEEIVREVLKSMTDNEAQEKTMEHPKRKIKEKPNIDAKRDYPLATKRPDLIKTPTNKSLDEITIKGILNGNIRPTDVRISKETLQLQAKIAESVGRDAFARNLKRAAELIEIPDERILEIYNALRPYRSTKEELMEIADELEEKYDAKINSQFIREAAEIYEKRNRLKKE